MFIGICGSICAGKSTVAQYLVQHHGFRHLLLCPVSECNGPEDSLAVTEASDGSTSIADDKLDGTGGASRLVPNSPLRAKRTSASEAGHGRLSFETAEQMLDFVTKQWQERWVTTHILDERILDIFSRRPFFLLISVDAPVSVRWRRFQQRQCEKKPLVAVSRVNGVDSLNGYHQRDLPPAPISLDEFVARSDAHLYDAVSGQLPLMSSATVRLLNTSPDIAHLFATLGKVDLLNEDRLRPSWDTYFMALASLAARRSNCMKRRVGCVLAREKRVISTGYNGTPRGLRNCGKGGCGRCNEGHSSGVGLATCMCIHAEENALLEAGRERIREGAILYCDTCPCLTCSIKIAQVGISEVVYSQGYSMDRETAAVLREAGVRLRQFVPPANGLIHLEKTELR